MIEFLVLVLMFGLIAIGVPIAVAILSAALAGLYMLRGELGLANAALSLFDGGHFYINDHLDAVAELVNAG